jgi:multiple antibiotic resistance protein
MENELFAFGLLAFTSFFTLINPLAIMPVFMTMTADLTPQARRQTAAKAVITAFITLMLFAFSGDILFNFFGISVASFRIVGGVIFFMMGYDMLQARLIRTKMDKESEKQYVTDISVTPLAIPMICGPGAITNGIVLMQDAKDTTFVFTLVGMIFVICLITFLVLAMSSTIIRLLGETGNKIMMRLMGLIVMVIAIEFFLAGLRPIVASF